VRRLVTFLVTASLIIGFSPGTLSRSPGVRLAQAAAPAQPQYLVVIVMDGFRPDYLNVAPMRHLRSLMKRGRYYNTAWVGQIESETPASHATIATGVYPRKHGVIGFGWRDRVTGGFTFMPTDLGEIQAGQLTQTVNGGGVPTISDLIHQRNKKDTVVAVSGEKLWASAPMGVGADYVLYGRQGKDLQGKSAFIPIAVRPNIPPPQTHYLTVTAEDGAFAYQDGFAARLAVRMVASLRPRALLLNLPAPDIAGHYFGGIADPKDMAPILRGTDYAIGLVLDEYRKLGLIDKTLFVVLADHGMVTGKTRVPGPTIKQAILKQQPTNLFDLELHNTIGSIWLHDPLQAPQLAATLARDRFTGVEGALAKVPDGSGGWKYAADPWTAAHLPANVLKAYLDLADTEASVSGSDVILPYKENTTGLNIKHGFHGMHGGFSWGAQHIPMIFAGPGVRPGVSSFPAKLVDVAPTIEHLLGLKVPPGVDGVVLADAAQNATPAERSEQGALRRARLEDVHALEAHSLAQSR
jgi:arylsulfatase A-like enzyme